MPVWLLNSLSTFFQGARDTTIHNGSFTSAARDIYQISSTTNNTIERPDEIEFTLLNLVKKGEGYRLHKAERNGKLVLVKVFSGPSGKSHFKMNLRILRKNKYMHSNIARVIQHSSVTENGTPPFFIYQGLGSQSCKFEYLGARFLETDLTETVKMGMKLVKGIAAAIDYLKDIDFPLEEVFYNDQCFDIVQGHENNPLFIIHAERMDKGANKFSSRAYGATTAGWLLFNRFCRNKFTDINSVLYMGLPEISDPADPSVVAQLLQMRFSHNAFVEPEVASSSRIRRELKWSNTGVQLPLDKVVETFDKALQMFSTMSIPRVRGKDDRSPRHTCRTYLREEIFFTPQVNLPSAIIIHKQPRFFERCNICGESESEGDDILQTFHQRPKRWAVIL